MVAQKTLFISNFHSLVTRNIFSTDVLPVLLSNPELKVVALVPQYKMEFFQREFQHPNLSFEVLELAPTCGTRSFRFMRWLAFSMLPTWSVRLILRERVGNGRLAIKTEQQSLLTKLRLVLRYIFDLLVWHGPARLMPLRRFVRVIDSWLIRTSFLEPLVRRYNPEAVFCTDIFSEQDATISLAATKLGLPVIGMVRSWDNSTSKGLLRCIPSLVIAPNGVVARELEVLHGVDSKIIQIGGIPQYDRLFRPIQRGRSEFFRKITLDPNRPIIMFAPAGCILSDTDWQVCQLLKDALRAGKLPQGVQFLVRSHPLDPAAMGEFEPDKDFFIDRPGVKISQGIKHTEMRVEEAEHLVESLANSALLIHVSSSIGLDSLPLDLPQIMIEFDGWEHRSYYNSVRRFHDEDHMRKFISTGAAAIVRTPADLLETINRYLSDPSIDRDKRTLAAKEQIHFLDDRAGERVAMIVQNALGVMSDHSTLGKSAAIAG